MKDYCKHCNRWFSDPGDMSQLAINGYCIECDREAEAETLAYKELDPEF